MCVVEGRRKGGKCLFVGEPGISEIEPVAVLAALPVSEAAGRVAVETAEEGKAEVATA